MLNILTHRCRRVPGPRITRVAIVGDGNRRAFVKEHFGKRVECVGELASDRRAGLLAEVEPDVVFLDCGSEDVNPLLSLPVLSSLSGAPRIVALIDRFTAAGFNPQSLYDLGAHAVIDIHDTQALLDAAGVHEERPETNERRRELSPVAA